MRARMLNNLRRRKLKREQSPKNAPRVSWVSILSIAISCIALWISFKSISLLQIEKGLNEDPKIGIEFGQKNLHGDHEFSIKNLSNTDVSILSVKFIEWHIDSVSKDKIEYAGIIRQLQSSFSTIKPFHSESKTITVDNLFSDDFMDVMQIHIDDLYRTILECRVYYIRKFDAQNILYSRSFYGGHPTLTSFVDESEMKEDTSRNNLYLNSPFSHWDEDEAELIINNFSKILNFIDILKINTNYEDSIYYFLHDYDRIKLENHDLGFDANYINKLKEN